MYTYICMYIIFSSVNSLLLSQIFCNHQNRKNEDQGLSWTWCGGNVIANLPHSGIWGSHGTALYCNYSSYYMSVCVRQNFIPEVSVRDTA